jgi:hypothetical protein
MQNIFALQLYSADKRPQTKLHNFAAKYWLTVEALRQCQMQQQQQK